MLDDGNADRGVFGLDALALFVTRSRRGTLECEMSVARKWDAASLTAALRWPRDGALKGLWAFLNSAFIPTASFTPALACFAYCASQETVKKTKKKKHESDLCDLQIGACCWMWWSLQIWAPVPFLVQRVIIAILRCGKQGKHQEQLFTTCFEILFDILCTYGWM